MTKDDRLYLVFIAECIQRIEEYTTDGRDGFIVDKKTQDAVLRNLHVLSESTQRLSDSLKARYPSVNWRIIAAFRNVIVHDYLGIDLQQVWSIVEHDLPDLKRQVAAIIDEMKP